MHLPSCSLAIILALAAASNKVSAEPIFAQRNQVVYGKSSLSSLSSSTPQHPLKISPDRTPIKTYADQAVFRFNAESSEELALIYNATHHLDLDIWSIGSTHIDVRITQPQGARLFKALPENVRKHARRMIPDLNNAVRRTLTGDSDMFAVKGKLPHRPSLKVPSMDETFFSNFQTIEAINAWLTLVTTLHPKNTAIINLGKSHEGRDIQGIHLFRERTLYERISGTKRKTILINGALHAREWISVSTVCYIAWAMIAGRSTDPEIARLLDGFDFVLFPTINVDGYAYTWQDRLWRKNRQPTSVPFCQGVDLDRNFAYGWGLSAQQQLGIQSNPCSENYQGAESFDAIETKLLSDWINSIHAADDRALTGYLDLHSYAQTILYPYALSCEVEPRDEETLLELAIGGSKAMKSSSGEHYDAESACNADGHLANANAFAQANAGAALDWVYHGGVHWAYVLKLRDTGSYGFLVPKEEILPTGLEVLEFVKYFGRFILDR
ncbi:Putative metallocarboxypeptidase ecm14 [Savitreella phatthalungensis]